MLKTLEPQGIAMLHYLLRSVARSVARLLMEGKMVKNIEIKSEYEKLENLANELGATVDQVIEIKKYLLKLERDNKKHLEKERKKKSELAVLNYSLGIGTNGTNEVLLRN